MTLVWANRAMRQARRGDAVRGLRPTASVMLAGESGVGKRYTRPARSTGRASGGAPRLSPSTPRPRSALLRPRTGVGTRPAPVAGGAFLQRRQTSGTLAHPGHRADAGGGPARSCWRFMDWADDPPGDACGFMTATAARPVRARSRRASSATTCIYRLNVIRFVRSRRFARGARTSR